jgi:hypothetical protein
LTRTKAKTKIKSNVLLALFFLGFSELGNFQVPVRATRRRSIGSGHQLGDLSRAIGSGILSKNLQNKHGME